MVDEETMRRSRPTVESVDVASVWDATDEPFKEVIVPPAPPASVPQVKVPFAQRSFSVEALHSESDAPKSDATVSPPVEEAERKESVFVVSEVTVVVAKVEVPCTLKSPLVVRLVVEASVAAKEVMVVVAKVEVPVTARVPCDVRDEVAVMVPPVMEEIVAVKASRMLVKKFVVVARVKTGVSVKMYVVDPVLVVATVKLEFVEEARKV